MTAWQISIRRAREELIEGLARLGFQLSSDGQTLRGVVEFPGRAGGGTHPLEVRLPDSFPFRPPKVRPTDGAGGMSWHREPAGWLCLYAEAESGDLPWLKAEALINRVIEWFARDLEGWPDDAPDLDLERYFTPVDGLVIYKDLDALLGKPIRAKRRGRNIIDVVSTGTRPRGQRQKNVLYGWAEDLGELEQPVHNWSELADLLGERAEDVAREIRRGRGELLLLRYRRREYTAAIALLATPGSPVELRAFRAADASETTLRLRAGLDASLLRSRSVAVVGVGAIGSFLADLLARCGIGRLELWDGQVLRPGNPVRHLAGGSYVGWNKAEAVADLLVRSDLVESDRVKAVPQDLADPIDAHRLMQEIDLVIDATAAAPVTTMLSFIARTTSRALLSVCIQRDGGVIRCDRWPLAPGEAHAAPVPDQPSQMLREAGCGDPVSPTAPSAVVEAAGLASRMATDFLTGRRRFGATLLQVLLPQEDAPYDQVRTLT